MTDVNPPPSLRVPTKILQDDELAPYFRQLNFIVYQSWLRSGGSSDDVQNLQMFNYSNNGLIHEIRQVVGSGNPLTSDCDTFTVDSDFFTADMDEA